MRPLVHVGVFAHEEGIEAFEAQALLICRGGKGMLHERAAGAQALGQRLPLQRVKQAHAGKEQVLLRGKIAQAGLLLAVGGLGVCLGRLEPLRVELVQGDDRECSVFIADDEAGELLHAGFERIGGVDGFCHGFGLAAEHHVAAFALRVGSAQRGQLLHHGGSAGAVAEIDGVFLPPGLEEAEKADEREEEFLHASINFLRG